MHARINSLAKIAKSKTDPKQFLADMLVSKRTVFDMAIVIAAYAVAIGEPSPALPHKMGQEAERVAERWFAEQGQPVGGARTERGLTTNYDIIPPSDEARAQERAKREKDGIVYVGPRVVRKPIGIGGGLPLHWGAEFLR